jgi:Asp-tRNA(Asn)/Glu-tRNA(Gln) amidotransferase A subunit family amidase
VAVETDESVVRAWVVRAPDNDQQASHPTGPLAGRTVGVKDVFDTADLPTEYGSPIYAGHRPRADAAAVALLRAAGARVAGKTVTAELAWFTPGPTANPHRPTHTPGGSSSGSAAAVAAGMCDLAIGTQTAGSVIRPASFCGVFGCKPTFGLVPTAGVKQVAPSLDTVGVFARDLDLLGTAVAALTARPLASSRPSADPTFAFVRTELWDDTDADGRRVIEEAAEAVGAAERDLPPELVGLAARQPVVQAYEGARAMAWERTFAGDRLSEGLRGILAWGDAIEPGEYDDVLAAAARGRRDDVVDALFGPHDVLVTPAVPGEAPAGLDATGDPRFCRLWTLLGWPTLTVPGLAGATGLPIGVQLVARPAHEHLLLAAGRRLASSI